LDWNQQDDRYQRQERSHDEGGDHSKSLNGITCASKSNDAPNSTRGVEQRNAPSQRFPRKQVCY
jgi:hypothetical protein